MVKIDIKMPQNCGECPFFYDLLLCKILNEQTGMSIVEDETKRLTNCPLVEIDT